MTTKHRHRRRSQNDLGDVTHMIGDMTVAVVGISAATGVGLAALNAIKK